MDERFSTIAESVDPVVVEVAIDARPERVWELVSDIDLPRRFSDEFIGAEWMDPPGPGSRFIGRNQRQDTGTWETVSTVTEWHPNRSFEWTVGDLDDPTAVWRFDIEPLPDGTRLTMSAALGPGRSFLRAIVRKRPDRAEQIVAERMRMWRANMESTVEGVRRLAEEHVAGGEIGSSA